MREDAEFWPWDTDVDATEWDPRPSGSEDLPERRAPRRVPEVDQVLPGLWSVPVPMLRNPLGYTLVYAFECGARILLVDAGLRGDESLQGLTAGLGRFGASLEDVSGVVVTHGHPDHYGLAGAIREASGAWVALHEADAENIPTSRNDGEALLHAFRAWLGDTGAPDWAIDDMSITTERFMGSVSLHRPDVILQDGQRIEAPGWDLTSIHTPGHTPGHVCLWEAGAQVMLTGDHVLPRITPNVSVHPQNGREPLSDYLDSLGTLRAFGDVPALPAHQWRLPNLRERIDEIIAHHERRLLEITRAMSEDAETLWEVTMLLEWSSPWNLMPPIVRRLALGETHAHLRVLTSRGFVEAVGEGPLRWALARRSP